MIFNETKLSGAFVIEPEKIEDERGFFARTWCQEECRKYGLNPRMVQCNISFNKKKGTLRGMHFQTPPYEEAKVVRCTRGGIFDVIVDLRKESPTFLEYFSVELTSTNHKILYIPEGFAHGFITLEKNTEVFYQMSNFYAADCARGFRWNEPAFNIKWPMEVMVISPRDQNYPEFLGVNRKDQVQVPS
jgi:dTDP-4-dehydrorhamnose 3,5-epimerase